MQTRLDKLLSESLAVSRQDAKKLLSKSSVTVNGVVVKKGDVKVDTDNDDVRANGKSLTSEKFVYIMLNKPEGVVSASTDKNDTTVIDLVKDDFPRRNLFPAGRLDKTSTGFVLITDDGQFAHDILSPKHHVPKTYIVTVDSPVTDEVIQAFEKGVTLADGQTMKTATIVPEEDRYTATIILHQGVYHQIKRMLGVFNIGVNSLHRVSIGDLQLDDNLKPGEYKKLSSVQLAQITNFKFTKN